MKQLATEKVRYFRFEIPRHTNLDIAVYPENWHGTMDRCPRDVKVLLYDDNAGFGIAQTPDVFMPPEVKEITEAEAKKVVAGAKDVLGVFKGTQIAKRFRDRELDMEATRG